MLSRQVLVNQTLVDELERAFPDKLPGPTEPLDLETLNMARGAQQVIALIKLQVTRMGRS